jgi:polysaccharide export outer membrane protein
MKRWILALVVVTATAGGAWARAQESSGQKAKANHVITARNDGQGLDVAQAAANNSSYIIGADDVINVSVWKEPEITRTVPVRPDGKISLPLVNDVQAAGETPMQLAAVVTTRLKKYLADPQVTVIVTQINSQRIYVLGEVTRAGAYPLLPGTTVLQALSSAGGFTQWAKVKDIYVLRRENGRQVKYPFNYKDVIKGQRTEQNIELKAGDTIVVP